MTQEEVTLKEHLELQINSLDRRLDTIFELNKIALDKAESKLDERLSHMNEFREQLTKQAQSFVTRPEFETKLELVTKTRRDNLALGLSLLGIIVAIIAIIIKV